MIQTRTNFETFDDVRQAHVALVGQLNDIVESYGQIHRHGVVAGYGVTASLAKMTVFNAAGPTGAGVTADAVNHKLTVSKSGVYSVHFSMGLYSAGSAQQMDVHVFKNGVDQDIRSGVYVAAALQVLNLGTTELISLTKGDYIELYLVGAGVTTVTVHYPRLVLIRKA